MIKSRPEGARYRAFYITSAQYPENEKIRFTNLQTDIIKLITEKNGISEQEIVLKLSEKQQTINYNLKRLQRKNIIKLEQRGRETFCFVNE